jgi:hypothetical protein
MPPTTTPATTLRRAGIRVALLVAGIWFVSAIPIVLGLSSCPIARFLHTPCPGCGMTRALELLFHGSIGASLAMHPLALPTLLVQMAFALVTIFVSFQHGTPFMLWKTRIGRLSVYAGAVMLALDVILWLGRTAGLMHGPVPV